MRCKRTKEGNFEKPVFQHGQLYVALSRATQKENVKVFVPGDIWTKNIVNKDVLH